jgi:colanic acid biosynthesis glycosyl transferase WcaI
LLLGAAAWLVGAIKRSPFLFHVQDMQPDAAVGLGMIRTGWFTKALYALEAFAYRSAGRVSGITRGMLDTFRRKGVPESKLIYFPNAIGLSGQTHPERGQFRCKHQFSDDDFLAVYAGNLGVKQGLEVLIDAVRLVRNQSIRIVICGDGAQRDFLAARIHEFRLPNVRMLSLQQGDDYSALLADADLCFITQQAGSGNSFFPSKLLGLLAFAKPVVTVAASQTELALALEQGGFGINIPPGQPAELARILDELAVDPARLNRFGSAGREYVRQFEKQHVLNDFARQLETLVASAP